MRKAVITAMGACALALGACGGDDEETRASSSQPKPKQPIAKLVGPFNKALAEEDCKAAAEAVFSVLREEGKPGAPATKKECKFLQTPGSFLQVLGDIEFTDSEEFGTAALMEAEVPPGRELGSRAAALWALDSDGEYRYVSVTSGDGQLGRSLPKGNDAEEAAGKFVESVRNGRCEASLINPEGTLAQGDVKAACEGIEEGARFAPALKADAAAKPKPMGATLDWAFYGVDTDDGFFTLILNSLPAEGKGQSTRYGVYDVLPASP